MYVKVGIAIFALKSLFELNLSEAVPFNPLLIKIIVFPKNFYVEPQFCLGLMTAKNINYNIKRN